MSKFQTERLLKRGNPVGWRGTKASLCAILSRSGVRIDVGSLFNGWRGELTGGTGADGGSRHAAAAVRALCACRSAPWRRADVSSRSILQPGSNVDDRARRPLAAARRRKPAIVEGLGDSVGALASELGQDLAELLRASVGPLAQARIRRPSSSQPDEFGHLQKSLNLPGDNSVYRTVCWMLRWPR